MLLRATSNLHFLISNHEKYQHGSSVNLWGGPNPTVKAGIPMKTTKIFWDNTEEKYGFVNSMFKFF
jgi:hypothetical protein